MKHLPTSRSMVRRAFDAANAIGDLTFAVYSAKSVVTNLLISGEPLGEVQREAEEGLVFAKQMQFGLAVDAFIGQLMLVRTLRGLTADVVSFDSFDDAGQGEGGFERHLEKSGRRVAVAAAWYWIYKLQAVFFAQDQAA